LFVTPEPINTQEVFAPEWRGLRGPAIEISERHADQNGDLFEKAEIIARVFPAYKTHAAALMDGFDFPENSLRFGPYPTDQLTCKGQAIVEYRTPPETEGLGRTPH